MLKEELPDITTFEKVESSLNLNWVGMEGIAIPLQVDTNVGSQAVNARASIFVSLDNAAAKGIHMSRLHKVVNKLVSLPCDKPSLDGLIAQSIDSQEGISKGAKVRLDFELLLEKESLLSQNVGFQNYTVAVTAEEKDGQSAYELELTIPYSSTCPCSASLARQLYSRAIDSQFPEAESVNKAELLAWIESADNAFATPHSQRSYVYLKLKLGQDEFPSLESLIIELENIIGTPVQAVVKRVDEQEFARLNGENLMFCEDAARRIKQYLNKTPCIVDYWLKVEHQESLHAHNAVVIDQKNS